MKRSKINVKSFILGFIVCTIITTMCVPAVASNITKTISAYYDDIKIYVDNSLVTPTDANGNVVEPFIYNGTTYLPVRAISNALGKEVTWDGNTSSVYIGTPPSTTPTPTPSPTPTNSPIVSISDNSVTKIYNGWNKNIPFTVNGNNVNLGTTGISFAGDTSGYHYSVPYATFKIDNSQGNSYLVYQTAKDDNFAGGFRCAYLGQTLSGSYTWYAKSDLATEQQLSNGFTQVTVDISKLKSISVYFAPNTSGLITPYVDKNGAVRLSAAGNSLSPFYIYDTYMLLKDICVYPF